jgi:hypothetical protein
MNSSSKKKQKKKKKKNQNKKTKTIVSEMASGGHFGFWPPATNAHIFARDMGIKFVI